MDFKVTEYKRACVVKGLGRIDSAVAPDIERLLTELIEKNKAIIFDMNDIDFVSSVKLQKVNTKKSFVKIQENFVRLNFC